MQNQFDSYDQQQENLIKETYQPNYETSQNIQKSIEQYQKNIQIEENKSYFNLEINQSDEKLKSKIQESKIYQNFRDMNVQEQIKNKLLEKLITPEFIFNYGGYGLIIQGLDKSNNKIVIKIFSSDEQIDKNDSINEEKQIYEKLKTIKKYNHFVEFIDHVPLIEKWDAFIYKQYKCSLEKLYCTKEKKISFTEKNLIKFIFDLIHGLIDLKRLSILHLDIKPQNILVDENNNLFYCDFGCSKIQKEDEEIAVNTFTQSFAPKEQLDGKSVDTSADVFCLGKTLKIILDLFVEINSNSKIKSFVDSVKNIIDQKMIQKEKENRLDCQDIHYQFSKLFQEIDKEFISMNQQFFDELQTEIKYQLEDNVDYFFEDIYKSLEQAKEKIKKQGNFELYKNSHLQKKKTIIQSINDFSNLNNQLQVMMNQQIQGELDFINQKFKQLVFNTKENNNFGTEAFKIYENSIKKMDEFLKKNFKQNVEMQTEIKAMVLPELNDPLLTKKAKDNQTQIQYQQIIEEKQQDNNQIAEKPQQNNSGQQSNGFDKREDIKDSYQQRSQNIPQELISEKKLSSIKFIKKMNVQKPNQ